MASAGPGRRALFEDASSTVLACWPHRELALKVVTGVLRVVLRRPSSCLRVDNLNPVTARGQPYRFNLAGKLGRTGHCHLSRGKLQVCVDDVVESAEILRRQASPALTQVSPSKAPSVTSASETTKAR